MRIQHPEYLRGGWKKWAHQSSTTRNTLGCWRKFWPRVIATAEEHERLLAEVEKLMDKGERRSAEEDVALDLMVRLIKSRTMKRSIIGYQIRALTRCWPT